MYVFSLVYYLSPVTLRDFFVITYIVVCVVLCIHKNCVLLLCILLYVCVVYSQKLFIVTGYNVTLV